MKSGLRPVMPHVARAQWAIMVCRRSRSCIVLGMMNESPTGSPVVGDTYVMASCKAGSCCMSYRWAMLRMPLRKAGWVVTSFTCSPQM